MIAQIRANEKVEGSWLRMAATGFVLLRKAACAQSGSGYCGGGSGSGGDIFRAVERLV